MTRKRIWLGAAAGIALIALVSVAQTKRSYERPVRQAVRGVHGPWPRAASTPPKPACGSYQGGNAVDVGVATMFAASVTELSHFGMGGEAPILIRTKDGKVYSIAGVGTMPKLATAEFFRKRPLQPVEMHARTIRAGLKGIIPVRGPDAGAGAGHGGRGAGGAARVRHEVLRAR